MKIGDSVRVKKGVKSPDYEELFIEGWIGRIIEIDENTLTIELDSITLSELKEDYIIDSFMNDFEYKLICLEIDEVESVKPRDSENDTLKKQMEINAQYSFDEEEKRISEILKSDDISVNEENLNRYFNFLKTNLKTPCMLTGMEDFDWEEPYILGGWSKKEYEKLKKTIPSYTDNFEFIKLEEEYDDWKGIYTSVKRISDEKIFTIPLWDLVVMDKRNSNFQIVTDYASWMTNNR
ncbi:MAG: hypothetical protein JXC36_04990 [Candidatus Atribacteria bacterium]|nr:hypothetical protein [Candidatus Atribacteria bacterium]